MVQQVDGGKPYSPDQQNPKSGHLDMQPGKEAQLLPATEEVYEVAEWVLLPDGPVIVGVRWVIHFFILSK
jgi:hypothetical protein